MKIEVIDNHSVMTSLPAGGPVLDAGCRGFKFAKWFSDLGIHVVAIDPADDLEQPLMYTDILFRRVALVAKTETVRLVKVADPEAWYIDHTKRVVGKLFVGVAGQSISDLTQHYGMAQWGLVKLNIEGSEIGVLESWPGPIARQIVVSFHLHTGRQTEADVERAVKHISQWYEPVRHEKDARYCAGQNYWDSLFILRDLL